MNPPASLRAESENPTRVLAGGRAPRRDPKVIDLPAAPEPQGWVRALVAVVIGLGLTAIVIQYSLRHGRLCTLPTYDDISYMSSGVQRLQTLYDKGVVGAWREYLHVPPHSPYSELLAMASFAVFGPHDWAPYAGNGLLAIAFVLAADSMLCGVWLWQRVICLIFFATIPFVSMAVHEFRPDAAEALVTALGLMVLLNGPLARSRWTHPVSAGVLCGLALLIKPSVSPATLVYFSAAFVLAILCDVYAYRQRLRFREIFVAWMLCIVPALLIAGPHYWLDHHQIFNYIYDLEFGKHASSVAITLPWRERLAYYINGEGGQPMLGGHVWILLTITGFELLWILRRRQLNEMLPALAVFLLILMAFAVPTLNPLKQPFLGLTFEVILAFAILRWLSWMLRRMQLRAGIPFWSALSLGVLLLVGLWRFQWPMRYGGPNLAWMQERNAIITRLYHDVIDHTTAPGPGLLTYDVAGQPVATNRLSNRPLTVFACIGDLSPELLQYMANRDGASARFEFKLDSAAVSDYMQFFDGQRPHSEIADFVVTADNDSGFFVGYMLSSPIQDQVVAALRGRPDYVEIDSPVFSVTHKHAYLFQRVDFGGWSPVSGFGPTEGPLKSLGEQTVRWGLAPDTTLNVTAPHAGIYALRWDVRSSFHKERMDVILDGKIVDSATVGHGLGDVKTFAARQITFDLTPGAHELKLHYSEGEKGTDMPRAVLFRALRLFEPKKPGTR